MPEFFDAPRDPTLGGMTKGPLTHGGSLRANPNGNRSERRAWKKRHPSKRQAPEVRDMHAWHEPDGWCVIHGAYDRPVNWQPGQSVATGFPSLPDAGAAGSSAGG
jgi:hypothetical protein